MSLFQEYTSSLQLIADYTPHHCTVCLKLLELLALQRASCDTHNCSGQMRDNRVLREGTPVRGFRSCHPACPW